MGFGFVGYKKPEQAQKALKQLQVIQGLSRGLEALSSQAGQGGSSPPKTEQKPRQKQ